MPKGHWPGRNWTPEQVAALEELLEAGWSDARIAARIGRSVDAVVVRRKRMGIPSRTSSTLNTRKVAEMLGVGCSKSVVAWIEAGYLKGRRGQRRGPNRQWLIREEDLMAFLEDPAHWHRWDAERVTDQALREWAMELPRPRYLTVGEVAARFFVASGTVSAWLDKGQLPFVRNGNRMVLESSLVGWTPPCERVRETARRRWVRMLEERGEIIDLGVAS